MLKRFLLVAVLVVALLIATVFVLLRTSLAQLDGEIAVRGLTAAVTVERDAFGIPTIRGQNRLDVARATGFLHAQERFFQMDLMRRRAAGELAALFGRSALPADQRVRLHRLRHVAEQALARLPESDRDLLQAYADGVNQGLARLMVVPPEYLLLRASPRAWVPRDTLLVLYSMYLQLADPDASFEARKAVLHDCLPTEMAAFIAGNDAAWAAPLDGGLLDQATLPDASIFDLRRLGNADFAVNRSFAQSLQSNPDVSEGNSNSWAVAGSRTRNGRALVANDMHLSLRVPNIWYRARFIMSLAQSPIDVTGVTLPGAPMMVAGSNRHVAWGFTNSYGDWSDRVLIEVAVDNPERYRTPDGFRDFEVHEETVEIKGESPVVYSMRWSIWGPVVRDHRNRPVAIHWLAHDPTATDVRIDAVAQAMDVDQALNIATTIGIPPQNIVVGDAKGNIGWTIAGRIPRRQNYDPNLPASWADRGIGWSGWLRSEEYPRIVNPEGGIIWTANHQIVTGEALARLGDGGYWHGARARQIRDGLRVLERASEHDMLAIQLDDRAVLLARWKDLLLSLLTEEVLAKHPRAREFKETVMTWSGRASADAASFRLVHAFRARVRDVVFAAATAPCRKIDPEFRVGGLRQSEGALWGLVEGRPTHLLNPGYASWEAQLQAVALETIEYFDRTFQGPFADRVWGERNALSMRHPMSSAIPWLRHLLDMSSVPLPGDHTVPRVQSPGHGASERFAVVPGREDGGYFHMPGGQSGHPLSAYYRKGHDAWVNGEARPFLPGAQEHELRLMPQ